MKPHLISFSIMLAISFASCSVNHKHSANAPATNPAPISLPGTAWDLKDLAGTPVLPNSHPTLTFPEPGKTAGNGSCNRFMGSVEISSSTIKFGALASTRMACAPAELGVQEGKYLKALGAASHYALQDSDLLIYSEGYDKPLRFSRSANAKP